MPRKEEENKRIRDTQRASILEAAKGVFARKGWATTIADIALAAKVSHGLIYHYFTNKEAIFSELMGQTVKSDPLKFDEVLQSEGTAGQRLEMILSGMLKYRREYIENFGITVQMAKEEPSSGNYLEYIHKIFQNVPNDDSEAKDLRELIMKRFQSIHDVIVLLIVEGQKGGEFAQDDPNKLALMIFTCIESLTRLALERPDDFRNYYPYTEIIMRMLKPTAEAPGTKVK